MHILTKPEAIEFVRERLDLFAHSERTNPFAGGAWTLHFLDVVAEDSWVFAIPEYLGHGRSLMLLYSDDQAPHRKSSLTNYYASLFSPLTSTIDAPPERAAALAALVGQLVKLRPRPTVLNFAPLDKECADTANLRQALAAHGWYTKQYDCFGNWHLPCVGMSFDDYVKGRDSQLINTLTRKRKKFESEVPGGARLEIVDDPGRVAKAMDAYDLVYAKSWKKPEPYRNFVRGWAYICAHNGWLRLGVAWLGETPIAVQFWFTMHGRAFIFKLAYDENHAKLSAGTVLSAHMFRHALDIDRVEEIDYLTGDDDYKRAWMTQRRQRVGIIACDPRTPSGLMIGAKEFAGELRQRWRARLKPRQAV